ncbi:hypothetical protein DV738_g2107, partial [Chaetothyriales sp. CBS 135597]
MRCTSLLLARSGHNVLVHATSNVALRTGHMPQAHIIMTRSPGHRRRYHAAIAFGSNLGNRLGYIEAALVEMRNAGLKVLKTSPIYETKPMYYQDQDSFLNGICYVDTSAQPLQLLDTLQCIENKLQRRREIDKGPRTIDLDVILYEDQQIQHDRLEVPHKLLHEREFVLRPLNDILPNTVVHLATTTSTVGDLYNKLSARDKSMSPITELSPSLPLIRATDPSRPTHIMAILNLTPDSFSDGGAYNVLDPPALQARVRELVAAGATIIDLGGQSTRPKADRLSAETELQRVLPAIHAIRSASDLRSVTISIDTFSAEVARQAIAAGADIINDVSAGLLDPAMLPTVAELGKTIIMMHMRGDPHSMTKLTHYPNGVVNGVAEELAGRVRAAEVAGIPRWRIILDPGIGFAKTQQQNLELLARLSEFMGSPTQPSIIQGLPWLVGTSRKGFIGKITGVDVAAKRVMGTAATITASIAGGADIVRVHDVKEMAEVVKIADWADDVSDGDDAGATLPQPSTTINKDGTKTVISYRINDAGQRVKVTRKIRTTVHKEKVNPAVAERRTWAKFGLETGKAAGPQSDTTSVGENIQFRPSRDWKNVQAEEAKNGSGKAEEKSLKEQLRDKKVKCRICQGEHFTARCPYKDTMAPADDGTTPAADPMADGTEEAGGAGGKSGGLGAGTGGYVPPHLRGKATGAGERMGGKYERDDLATLRVTNVSEMAEEQELRDIFERYGRVTRVFLAKDRDTGRAKGFAFISYVDRADAARACEKLDGYGYKFLILKVEFAKKPNS